MSFGRSSGGATDTVSRDLVPVPLANLRVGATLRAPIFDARSGRAQLLLAAGTVLTPSQLEVLRRRGVTILLVHRNELDRLTGSGSSSARPNAAPVYRAPVERSATAPRDARPEPAAGSDRSTGGGWKNDADSLRNTAPLRTGLELSPDVVSQFNHQFAMTLETTRELYDEFARRQQLDARQIDSVSKLHVEQISTDIDAFVGGALRPARMNYPSQHGLQTAMLATSMGTIMGLRQDELIEMGFGCLVHDAGMLLVPQELREARRPLTATERLEIMKHPNYIADALNPRNDVSQASKLVAFQMHERMNGSGYPRQRQGQQIHLYSRIGAVADTYVALVSNRPQRPGLTPYQAVERILFATRHGLYDPSVVRALLHTASLFPIGSAVTLSDGRLATVIRANHDDYLRPVIQVKDAFAPEGQGEVIDLLQNKELSIINSGPMGGEQPTPATLSESFS